MLLLVTVSAAVSAGLAASAFAQDPTSTTSTTTTSATSQIDIKAADMPAFGFGGGMMMVDGFSEPPGRHGGFGGPRGYVEVSAEYNTTVSNILAADSDVQKLISEGYNVTAIRPKLSSTIASDGTVTTKASTAIVTLQNGTSGFATARVDVTNEKVTEIVIVTRTVIDKSAS